MPAPFAFIILLYGLTLFFGALTTAFLFIHLNAFFPVVLAVSFLVLIIIFFKFLQPLNAFLPIFFIFAPIVTFASFLFPLKALLAIDVTLYDLPLILILAGIVIFFTFFGAVNAAVLFVPADVTLYFEPFTVTFLPAFTLAAGFFYGSVPGAFVGSVPGFTVGSVPGAFVGSVPGAFVGSVPGAVLGLVPGAALGFVPGAALGVTAGTGDGDTVVPGPGI